MKKIVLSALCLATFFSGTYAMIQESEQAAAGSYTTDAENPDVALQDTNPLLGTQKKKREWKKKGCCIVAGALLLAGCLADGIASLASLHPESWVNTAYPFSNTLPADFGKCTYRYGQPRSWVYPVPPNHPFVGNWKNSCVCVQNVKECDTYCAKRKEKKEKYCFILEECFYEEKNDPGLRWSLIALGTEVVLICMGVACL